MTRRKVSANAQRVIAELNKVRRAAKLADKTDPLPDGRRRWPDPTKSGWRPSTPDEWAGWARVARARELAGVPLDDLDREALAGGHSAGAPTRKRRPEGRRSEMFPTTTDP